jgi:hypothetical protein
MAKPGQFDPIFVFIIQGFALYTIEIQVRVVRHTSNPPSETQKYYVRPDRASLRPARPINLAGKALQAALPVRFPFLPSL